MIWKNFRRELLHTTSRLISVIIITAVAVLMHIALSGVIYNGDKIMKDYFREQNVADYWITATDISYTDCRKLKSIPGVLKIQPQMTIDAENRYNEDISILLYGIADGYQINTPLIIEGTFPTDNREMMISSAFAEKQGLNIGDTYEMKLSGTGQILKRQICALIKSPECMFHINASSLVPDYSKYGFAYMDADSISDIFGKNSYNQACIKISDDINEEELKAEINEIFGNRLINILALKDNLAAYHLTEQIDGLRPVIVVFPMMFFMVSVLIMFSTMSRLIENARMSIGTMKALGYYDRTILLYYSLYSIIVVLAGFLIGSFPATELVTKPIANTLFFMVDMPATELLPDKTAWLMSFVLTCIFCIGTALTVTIGALKEKPVECMRPKPPGTVKKLIVEKVSVVWNLLNFSQKYIIRNIFRNKPRMLICVVGVAGCMTLVLTSFTINDSIQHLLLMLAENEHQYDYAVDFDRSVTKEQYTHIGNMELVIDSQYEMITSVKIYTHNKMESAALRITDDKINLKLIDTFTESPFTLPENGAVLEKDIADKLDLKAGDIITIKFVGKDKYYKIPVLTILDATMGITVSRSYFRNLGQEFIPTSIYVNTTDADRFKERISDYDFVTSSKSKAQITGAMESQVSSLSMVVFLLIFFGGILALVVLYNLGIMSFYEQTRSLATLLVLGFYDKETRKLLLTENLAFTAIGIVFGIPLGIVLGNKLLDSVGTFTFELSVKPISFVISIILTMLFAIIINIMLGRKMAKIDMLGALKSVE